MKRLATSVLAMAVLFSLVVACAAPTPEVVEKEVIVEKEVPVTVEVEKEVIVKEKVVETVEVEVEKEVVVEKIIVAECPIDPPAEPTTINYLGWPISTADGYAEEMRKCNAVENLKVNVRVLDSISAQEQMRLAFSAGGPSPFQLVWQSNASIQQNAWQGWLLPLNDLVDKYRDEYDLDDIPQVAWDAATFEGNIYAIPVAANTIHFMYRSDLFEKYGLEPPTTYDEVIAACEVLKDEPSIDLPFTMDLSAGWAWEIAFFEFLGAFGGDYFFNDDNTPAFNSPEGIAALTKLKEVADACMGREGLTYGYQDSIRGLQNGSIAFIHTWASETPVMDDPEKCDFVGLIEFAPAPAAYPGGPLGASSWNGHYAIPATTAVDPELIFRVIMQLADVETQMKVTKVGLVTRRSALESEGALRSAPVALECISKGVGPYPKSPALPLLQAALGNWLPLVGTGELSPQEALDKAAEEYVAEATAQGYLK